MSLFEKIITPLVDESFSKEDISTNTGFIDSFTSDPDKPSGFNELFLVYNEDKRTEESIKRARKFESNCNLKRKYVKYVNNKPYLIYSFWISPSIKNLYNSLFTLSTHQKSRILQFWGEDEDVVKTILSNIVIQASTKHEMPLADYQRTFLDVN